LKTNCGKTPVEYDEKTCSYTCSCFPRTGCWWETQCTDEHGTRTIRNGSGISETPPPRPTITVAGRLVGIAATLEEQLETGFITVPPELRQKVIRKRTFEGTPEEVAGALGLTLSPKREGRG
jgi:hypothetical protein